MLVSASAITKYAAISIPGSKRACVASTRTTSGSRRVRLETAADSPRAVRIAGATPSTISRSDVIASSASTVA